jgi:ribonuclease HII
MSYAQGDLKELNRLQALNQHERQGYKEGYKTIAGVDEAGRGPLAGPVVAAACILPQNYLIPFVNDSKKLSAEQRNELYQRITEDTSISWASAVIDVEEIDRINILRASLKAMRHAIAKLSVKPELVLVDGNMKPISGFPERTLIKGDQLSLSIAASSIIAKVTRDRIMIEFGAKWPEWGFERHKGYATEEHLQVLNKKGPLSIHRRSFTPIKEEKQLDLF